MENSQEYAFAILVSQVKIAVKQIARFLKEKFATEKEPAKKTLVNVRKDILEETVQTRFVRKTAMETVFV